MAFLESYSTEREMEHVGKQNRQEPKENVVVLMADNHEDNYLLVKETFEDCPIGVDLHWVTDGDKAMNYLLRRGDYAEPESSPFPNLILLNIIMPRKDGLETLKDIKGSQKLGKVPVVLLATSKRQDHEASGLKLGADSFIVKPHDFSEIIKILNNIHEYYLGVIRLPDPEVIRHLFRVDRNNIPDRGLVMLH